jgi:hypothetical protein
MIGGSTAKRSEVACSLKEPPQQVRFAVLLGEQPVHRVQSRGSDHGSSRPAATASWALRVHGGEVEVRTAAVLRLMSNTDEETVMSAIRRVVFAFAAVRFIDQELAQTPR